MKASSYQVVVDPLDASLVVDGFRYLYWSQTAAIKASARHISYPAVLRLRVAHREVYLALGEQYLTDGGELKRHYYGALGKRVTIVDKSK
jgi:hypothetical protein